VEGGGSSQVLCACVSPCPKCSHGDRFPAQQRRQGATADDTTPSECMCWCWREGLCACWSPCSCLLQPVSPVLSVGCWQLALCGLVGVPLAWQRLSPSGHVLCVVQQVGEFRELAAGALTGLLLMRQALLNSTQGCRLQLHPLVAQRKFSGSLSKGARAQGDGLQLFQQSCGCNGWAVRQAANGAAPGPGGGLPCSMFGPPAPGVMQQRILPVVVLLRPARWQGAGRSCLLHHRVCWASIPDSGARFWWRWVAASPVNNQSLGRPLHTTCSFRRGVGGVCVCGVCLVVVALCVFGALGVVLL
jgi:hypothetical protein